MSLQTSGWNFVSILLQFINHRCPIANERTQRQTDKETEPVQVQKNCNFGQNKTP